MSSKTAALDFLYCAKKLASQDKRFHYVSLAANRGVSYARNLGASLGNGAFVAFSRQRRPLV